MFSSLYAVRQAGHRPFPVSRILWKHHTHTCAARQFSAALQRRLDAGQDSPGSRKGKV